LLSSSSTWYWLVMCFLYVCHDVCSTYAHRHRQVHCIFFTIDFFISILCTNIYPILVECPCVATGLLKFFHHRYRVTRTPIPSIASQHHSHHTPTIWHFSPKQSNWNSHSLHYSCLAHYSSKIRSSTATNDTSIS
jgi:hypothetical protein